MPEKGVKDERIVLINSITFSIALSQPDLGVSLLADTYHRCRNRLKIVEKLAMAMRSAELKHLRWRDVDFFVRTITIRRSKTDAGERVVPINADALSAMLELLRQAQKAQLDRPEHFIFPACESGRIDPSKPQKSWRTTWRTLTRGVRCPACGEFQGPDKTCRKLSCKADISNIKSPFARLRFHDLRHIAVTILAESDAGEQTVMAIAGHVSQKMLEHYSHIRMKPNVAR